MSFSVVVVEVEDMELVEVEVGLVRTLGVKCGTPGAVPLILHSSIVL